MITIRLKDGTEMRFNLKSQPREKLLRDAWYSMNDMPRYKEKVLNIKTDMGFEYRYAVGQIDDCRFSPDTFNYSKPMIKKAPRVEKRTFENSITEGKKPVSNVSHVLNKFVQDIGSSFESLFSSIPEESRERLSQFAQAINSSGLPMLLNDEKILDIIQRMLDDTEGNLESYVKEYVEYLKNKNL